MKGFVAVMWCRNRQDIDPLLLFRSFTASVVARCRSSPNFLCIRSSNRNPPLLSICNSSRYPSFHFCIYLAPISTAMLVKKFSFFFLEMLLLLGCSETFTGNLKANFCSFQGLCCWPRLTEWSRCYSFQILFVFSWDNMGQIPSVWFMRWSFNKCLKESHRCITDLQCLSDINAKSSFCLCCCWPGTRRNLIDWNYLHVVWYRVSHLFRGWSGQVRVGVGTGISLVILQRHGWVLNSGYTVHALMLPPSPCVIQYIVCCLVVQIWSMIG